jgi:uridine kinase
VVLQFLTATEAFVIGIAGGSGSGKSRLAAKIHETLGNECILLEQDSYYKDLSYLPRHEREGRNFDHPFSLDFDLLAIHIHQLKNGNSILKPIYDFNSHTRTNTLLPVEAKKIVVVEGILILAIPEIRELLDMKIFIEAEDDIRILRRLERDIRERGRDFTSIKNQYITTVKPMHDLLVVPSKQHADVIIPSLGNTLEAEKMIISRLKEILDL